MSTFCLYKRFNTMRFFNQFTPQNKAIMPLRCQGILEEKEKTLAGTGNLILNRKQEMNLYPCSKDRLGYDPVIGEPILF